MYTSASAPVNELIPNATAIVDTIVENAANAVRQAYVLGSQQGNIVLRPGGISSLDEWRTEMLARYATPSWKRTIVQLIPRCRFRATDIYVRRRPELEALQAGNNTLSVGTHNTLGAMLREGVLAKLGDVWAPAVGGVALAVDAEEAVDNYRPREACSERFARLLGFTVVAWSILEEAIVELCEGIAPGAGAALRDQPYRTQALAFADVTARFAPAFGPAAAAAVQALVDEFRDLANRRADLFAARPFTVEGNRALRAPGSAIEWNALTLMETCSAFERMEGATRALLWRIG
jgi:hypothetical protein